jgi:hypothetical protein
MSDFKFEYLKNFFSEMYTYIHVTDDDQCPTELYRI